MSENQSDKDQQVRVKKRIPKPIINTFIGVIVLLVLIVGGGVAYTWYMGQNGPEPVVQPVAAVSYSQNIIRKPMKPAANAPVSASVQTITSPVSPGTNASITVRTKAESKCLISVTYNNIPSRDSGLAARVADDYGMVSWTWTVEQSVPLGKWPVKVTCVNKDKSAEVRADLLVQKQP